MAVYVIVTSKPGHFHAELNADFLRLAEYDYEFCGRVRARFVLAELLRDSRLRIVDESEVPTVNEIPTKFLRKFPSAEAALDELGSLARFADMDIRITRSDLGAAASEPSSAASTARITFAGNGGKVVVARAESNLLRVSLREGGGIPFKCGAGLCGTCRCRIEGATNALDAVKAKERKHLSETELAAGWRMACQTFVRGDVVVHW